MRVTIEAINTPNIYKYRGSVPPELRIYSLASWITYYGQFVPKGSPNQKDSWYLREPCEMSGDDIILIPTIEIDSTLDALPPTKGVRYAARLFTPSGRMIGVFPTDKLASFVVPAVEDLTWSTILQYNDGLRPSQAMNLDTSLISQMQVLIDDTIGARDYASTTRLGMGYSSVDPVSPIHPVFIEEGDSRVAFTPVAQGLAVLVGGVATVLTDQVTTNSNIQLTGQSDDVSGTLRISNRVPGVSFDIASDNGADSGIAGWVMFA